MPSWCSDFVLVIGIVGEYAKSDKWRAHLRAFEVLVVIGVAGELFADGGIFLFSRRLQAISDEEVARLTVKAEEAEQKAAEARERTAIAELEMEQIRERQKDRWLRFSEMGRLGKFEAMLRSSPKGIVQVIYLDGDAEAFDLADAISGALKRTDWNVPSPPEPRTLTKYTFPSTIAAFRWCKTLIGGICRFLPSGVKLVSNSGTPIPGTAFGGLSDALLSEFDEIGGSVDKSLADNTFQTIVDRKP